MIIVFTIAATDLSRHGENASHAFAHGPPLRQCADCKLVVAHQNHQ